MTKTPATEQQARLYLQFRSQQLTQLAASAKAGLTLRTAQRIESSPNSYLMKQPKKRNYKTRPDPFESVWQPQVVPMLMKSNGLDAITILRFLQQEHPGQFPDRQLRTLQRRIKRWRALEGPEQEVMFQQVKTPGKVGIVDFTWANELDVTIGGEALEHRLFHFRLPYSGWHWSTVVLLGESYTALAEGIELALKKVGGSPSELRTDSLSAAWNNRQEEEEMTRLFKQLCDHYCMEGTHNNKGKGHENGWIESPHGHLKHQIDQHLMLRGHRDFDSLETYRAWLRKIHMDNNSRLGDRLAEELQCLQALPKHDAITWKPLSASVTTYSTISIDRVLYTVPSRLKGEKLNVHLFDDRIELFLGDGTFVHGMPRLRSGDHNKRVRCINYRHVIHSLVRKPGALPGLVYLDDLHPSPIWRRAWMLLSESTTKRQASKTYLGLLLIAHEHCCETEVAEQLERDLSAAQIPDLERYREQFKPTAASMATGPEFDEVTPSVYDQTLLTINTHQEKTNEQHTRSDMAGG